MKCTFIYSILFGFISFAMTAQSLNVDLMDGLQNKLVRWQAIDLNQQLTYSYSKLATSHETVALFAAYHGIKGLRYQTCNGLACTPWQAIASDEHVSEGGEANNEAKSLLFLDPNHDQIIFAFDKKNDNASLKLALRYYLNENENHEMTTVSDRKCTCSPLNFVSRTQWNCPDTEETSLYTPDYTQHTHIVIHHQAGSANPPFANTVKAIWDFHVNGNGWSDIGYNWLIAPDGTIYKGRSWLNGDQNVRGAHTCACNSNKLGICLLGDLTTKLPTTAQYESLKNFIVWKACELDILPDSSSTIVSSRSGTCIDEYVHHITGHRDNCGSGYTACPGDKFYPALESLKHEVATLYAGCADTLNTSYLEPTAYIQTKIYPNPNDGQLTIELSQKSKLTIFDGLGQKVGMFDLTAGMQTIATGLDSGFYFLNLLNERASTKIKIYVR